MRQSTFPRSGVLILAPTSIRSLLPSTLISQVESLLESHRIADAVNLADQQRRKIWGKGQANGDEDDELRYVYQRLGFQCFTETLFEDAGNHFFDGDLDPRVLVSYYPELRGSLFNADDSMEVFAGVAEHMPHESSVDDIIMANLVRNYSPHLPPSTRSAPPTAELRKILGTEAEKMLELFLRKRRTRKRMTEPTTAQKGKGRVVSEVEDTVLAKLFARSEKTADLYALLNEPNDIIFSEIEPVLRATGQYAALCMVYNQFGDDAGLLDAWSKLIDGEWIDEDVSDPLSSMITLLNEKRDRALTQKWGIWLTKRDPDRGIKLLTSRDSSKRGGKTGDDVALLHQVREANPAAGDQFLEYLVLQKRSTAPELHKQLAMAYIEKLLGFLASESVSKLWRAKASSYASSPMEASFLSYFASTTPDSEHKRMRLKTILFLQGSTLYDATAARNRLIGAQKILKLELAIVDGKLGNHLSALTILVHDLRDAIAAEAYCMLGGDVVPSKLAQSIGEKCGVQLWASAFFLQPATSAKLTTKAPPLAKQKSVEEGLKTELLKILLEVYMNDGESNTDRTAQLLKSQSMNLDVADVLSLVPPNWSLNVLSSFLARSLRRTLHARHEGQIVKSISAGQNLEVTDRTYPVLRDYGAIVEEALDEEVKYDEKEVLSEKVSLQLQGLNGIGHGAQRKVAPSNPHSDLPS